MYSFMISFDFLTRFWYYLFEYISLKKELGSRLPEAFSSAVLDYKIFTWICFRCEPFLFVQVFFHFLNCFCYLLFEYILLQKKIDPRLPEAFSSDVLDFKYFWCLSFLPNYPNN